MVNVSTYISSVQHLSLTRELVQSLHKILLYYSQRTDYSSRLNIAN